MDRDGEYLDAVRATLEADPAAIAAWLTHTCPECGHTVDDDDDEGHTLVGTFVVIGCEGYHIVDPNACGLERPRWSDWTDQ